MITHDDIALARVDHAAAIADLSRRVIEQGLEWRWTPRRVVHAMADAETNVVVALRGHDLLGFGIMRYGHAEVEHDGDAHLLLLATQPRCRRQGVGRALVGWLEDTARVAGLASLRLESRSDNARARHFYRTLGFEECGQRPGYYQGVAYAVCLRKPLRSTG